MFIGMVVGRLVATHKLPVFKGIKLLMVQPLEENRKAINEILVACDTVQAGEGDIVIYEVAREATFPLPDRFNPSDATITGIIDQINIDK